MARAIATAVFYWLDMPTPTTAEEALAAAALGPKSVRVGPETVEARDLKDLIAAADRETASAAALNPFLGLRGITLISPGCGGDPL